MSHVKICFDKYDGEFMMTDRCDLYDEKMLSQIYGLEIWLGGDYPSTITIFLTILK
jgi:hypothetical protein